MNLPLPPDPYKILNVPVDAPLPTIRSAHRKLVLKCHPDKVQDAAEKLIKQDEFQKVQEAYELLSDDRRRTQYDEAIKLIRKRDELREEMGRSPGQPTVFEFEIRTAEPGKATTTTTYTTSARPKQSKASPVYPHPRSTSFDDMYDEPSRTAPRKTASYESDRKRTTTTTTTTTTTRESERERKSTDEEKRRHERREQEKRSSRESKKSRDKDRRRGTEEKVHRTYVEDDSDDYREHSRMEKKASAIPSRKIMEEHIRAAEDAARFQERAQREAMIAQEKAELARAEAARAQEKIRPIQLPDKYEQKVSYATQYVQASRGSGADKSDAFTPPPLRRAETSYPTPSYVRYEAANIYSPNSDDEAPRRSSARTRKSSETPSKSRDVPKAKDSSRRSPPSRGDSYIKIVESPSPPSLQKHTSEPPLSSSRQPPSRSKTEQYPTREEKMPPSMTRAQTFTQGAYQTVERPSEERNRGRGSRLKQEYYSGESDSEQPIIVPAHTRSPVREQTTRYKVADGRATKLREVVEPESYLPRERSEERARPQIRTTQSARQAPTRPSPATTAYYAAPEAPEPIPIPIVRDVRPKTRDPSRGTGTGRSPYYGEINYSPPFRAEDIVYASVPYSNQPAYITPERRGSESHRPATEYTSYPPRRTEAIY